MKIVFVSAAVPNTVSESSLIVSKIRVGRISSAYGRLKKSRIFGATKIITIRERSPTRA